ncbi:HAMP domain-containing histidine kinase [Gluconobacter cerinus]|uniref:histidine kinase n=1 Tax=Gluconobacter cerinus TaxID=38307 RepID=A0A1B6VFN3_9PROT|nr:MULTISPECIES: HAMP domain-containing sensor histidine kinase [Gluconobacter]MBM3097333.1 HAMP domain-containing histidine kinase [Gluconobacter cerinus]MBS0982533.1 HAMP domain-containing histidine kinase [Gluconobacter cerinus]OAJ66041.1 two-component system sensor histidine kinase [Gluconobacter cerinus]
MKIWRGFRRLGKRLRWPIRSAGLNFALAYGLVFIISAGVFLSFIWWNTTGQLDRQVEAAVQVDAHDLAQRWVHGGPAALALAIQDRLDQNVEDDELYLLVGPDGRKYAGNLPGWPVVITQMDEFYELSIRRDGFRTQAKMHAFPLSEGFRLIVGRDVRGRQVVRHVLTDTLIWAWVMVSLLAAGGTLAIRRIFRQVVRSIARTTSAVAQGDLGRRIPLTGNETDLVAQTVNTMLERINRLMDGVRQVSNAIAHDLRTPIARARARLEDASLTATSEDELRAAIDRAVLDLDHVTSIFEALLRIAQLEAGAQRAAFTVLDIPPLLEGLSELYEASMEDAGLKLDVRIGALAPVNGDPHLLQQAVANLLDNAIKFAPENTTITLSAVMQKGRVAVSVSDQGPGMSEQDMARASERFFRAETARNTPGAGLGLSLVQAVVQLHGGTMELSDGKPGLRVTLLLPALQNAKTLPA